PGGCHLRPADPWRPQDRAEGLLAARATSQGQAGGQGGRVSPVASLREAPPTDALVPRPSEGGCYGSPEVEIVEPGASCEVVFGGNWPMDPDGLWKTQTDAFPTGLGRRASHSTLAPTTGSTGPTTGILRLTETEKTKKDRASLRSDRRSRPPRLAG